MEIDKFKALLLPNLKNYIKETYQEFTKTETAARTAENFYKYIIKEIDNANK